MQQIQGDGFTVTVKKSNRRKTTALTIKRGEVFVHIPTRLPIVIAQQFIKEKTAWIKQKLEQQSLRMPMERDFINGEVLLFLGEKHTLQLVEKSAPVSVLKNEQNINVHGRLNRLSKAAIRAAIILWFKHQAAEYLSHRTHQLSIKTGLKPKSITIKTYKARWGSCGIHGDIQFNWKLMLAPPEIIDYVIIHELCHIKQHNHSAAFWHLVEQHYPYYIMSRNWLKYNGYNLNI